MDNSPRPSLPSLGKRLGGIGKGLKDAHCCTQPVIYEFGQLQMPTLLLIGDKDTTAIGKDLAPPDVRAQLGRYPVLAKAAQRAIPHATLVEFADLGHAPQMQDPQAFHAALLKGLDALNATH